MNQFELIHVKTERFLQVSGYTAQSLLICVMDIKHVKYSVESSTLRELRFASSVSDVFHVLKKRNLFSFLHYEIMKRIIIKLCSEYKDLQMTLASYEGSYEQFIRIPVRHEERFELFKETDPEDSTDLVVTTDDGNKIISFADILDLENIIAKVFRCSQVVLHTRYIELQPPHLTLVYGIPCSLVDSIFPLTLEEWDELRSHDITAVHCADCHYVLDDKGSALEIMCVLTETMLLLTCCSCWWSHGIC